jgi:Amidohydrolase family
MASSALPASEAAQSERSMRRSCGVSRRGDGSIPLRRRRTTAVAPTWSYGERKRLTGFTPGGCCGYGHFAGVSNHNAVVRLAQFGFSPLEAIRIATLNGATFLGIADRTGSIAVGKEADLVIVRGDPSVRIEDIRRVEHIFGDGVQYDPARLLADVKEMVGWR